MWQSHQCYGKSRYKEVCISKGVSKGGLVGFESVRLFRKGPVIIIRIHHGTSVENLEMETFS